VVRCLVENLEDYQGRLEARELVWDPNQQCLIPLDKRLREDLCSKALCSMETGLVESLKAAAAREECPEDEQLLSERTKRLRGQCAALLDRKTDATQVLEERTMKLRREVMLFEAVEHLELHGSAGVSITQVRSAMHMVDMVEPIAPPEAVQRLRARLDRLAIGLQSGMLSAAPAG
jgi:hypothetical protein